MRKRWQLPRRTFLIGAGSAIALPFLDVMDPWDRRAKAQASSDSQKLIFWCMTNGIDRATYDPRTTGPNWELTPLLQPLGDRGVKEDVTVVTGGQQRFVDRAAGHGPATGAALTCVTPSQNQIRAGISIDQVLAQQIGSTRPFRSLELGTSPPQRFSADGYPTSYNAWYSWSDATTQLPPEIDPRRAFERLVGRIQMPTDADPTPDQGDEIDRRALYLKSVLDTVAGDIHRLNQRLGAADRSRLDQYLTHIRDLESSIQTTSPVPPPPSGSSCERPSSAPPAASDPWVRARQMNDLMVLAMACELTRVITFVYDTSATGLVYTVLSLSGGYHLTYAHHGNNSSNIEGYRAVCRFTIDMYAELVQKLKAHNLLDTTTALMMSEHSDGNPHSTVGMPCIIAGRAGGRLRPGRHIALDDEPYANIYIALASLLGVELQTFGQEGRRAASIFA